MVCEHIRKTMPASKLDIFLHILKTMRVCHIDIAHAEDHNINKAEREKSKI